MGIVRESLPTGTVTFLITDIEGSTALVIELGAAYTSVLERHNELLRQVVSAAGGTVVSTAGDSVFAVFPSAVAAVDAAVAGQRALAAEPWPHGRPVRVRMGLHSGEGVLGADDYVGLDVHRAARISAAAHGGQVVVSATTAALLGSWSGGELLDLGEHRLKDLVQPERVFQVAGDDLERDFPALRSTGGALTVLPIPTTTFVERAEVDEVLRLLATSRLLTVTGPGGTGKTRLAVESALRAKPLFPDGVVFVDLAPVTHPDLVASAVIGTLGLEPGSTSAVSRLAAFLQPRRMLLVLDNFEQVLDASDVVAELLDAAPGLRVLVTSRSRLRLSGEQELPLPPLGVPDTGTVDVAAVSASPAVQLFVARAVQARPDFTLDAENAAAVAQIVAHLDGLPLAVELAAARTRLLSPRAIAERLVSSGSGVLGSGSRDLPGRHRSLSSVIGWSHDLLDEDGRRAFRRFSVFTGGAALEQVEAVLCSGPGDDVLSLLEELADQSLVRVREVDGEPRFRMLVTIREYAAEQLSVAGEVDATRRAHAEAYLALAETAAPHLTGWHQRQWLDRLERDHDNLRSAVDWTLAQRDADLALRLVVALWRFWQIRGHLDEAARLCTAALALPTDDVALRARGLEAQGGIAWWRGDIPGARTAYDAALALVEPLGDLAATANARYNLGLALGFSDEAPRAFETLQQAAREAREVGDERTEAWAIWGLADVGIALGDWQLASGSAEEALRRFRLLDEPFGIGWSAFMTANGQSRAEGGDRVLARARLHEAIRLFAGFRDLSAVVLICGALARVEALDGHGERALRLLGAAQRLREVTGAGLLDFNEQFLQTFGQSTAEAVAGLGIDDETAHRLVAEGATYSPDEVVAYALEEMP